MATKDWEKHKDSYGETIWYNNSNGKVEIFESEETNKFIVRMFKSVNIKRPKYSKNFKTKTQALRFAKAYMRKH